MKTNEKKPTPMMSQYYDLKKDYKDSILLYRLGDFYEMFDEDAIKASKILNTKLTKRNPSSTTLMCGIPHHASERHIIELLNNQMSVAICEQVGVSNDSGIMERKVTRFLTPSNLIEFSEDPDKYFKTMSVFHSNKKYNIAILNINNGEITVTIKDKLDGVISIINESEPIEIISNIDLQQLSNIKTTKIEQRLFDGYKTITKNKLADELLISSHKDSIISANTLLEYINKDSSKSLNNIKKIKTVENDYLIIDSSSFDNLNLIDSEYSLFKLLNKTKSSSGARRLRDSIKRPFNDIKLIKNRMDFIEYLIERVDLKELLSSKIRELYDVERLVSQISSGSIKPTGLINLSKTLSTMIEISNMVDSDNNLKFDRFKYDKSIMIFMSEIINNSISDDEEELNDDIFIKKGYDPSIDSYIDDLNDYDSYIIKHIGEQKALMSSYSEKLSSIGIINSISDGLCIEVPKRFENDFKNMIAKDNGNLFSKENTPYIVKSIKSKSRYKTETLKRIEDYKIVINDNLKNKQMEIYRKLINELSKHSKQMIELSNKVSEIDVIISLTESSTSYGLKKPVFSDRFSIENSYHPLLLLNNIDIVKNNICFGERNTHLITGPNMSGKSTIMRQSAMIIIMYQIGCYIPADSGTVKIYDKILSRVGSNDDMSSGKSTFMVEMIDIANIFKNATKDSFVIVDEVGRGTKPSDGAKIAIAITEGLIDIGCDTLISTHYEELINIKNDKIKKMHLSTDISKNGDIIFSHKLLNGESLKSYAIEIAKLAGVPKHILSMIKI